MKNQYPIKNRKYISVGQKLRYWREAQRQTRLIGCGDKSGMFLCVIGNLHVWNHWPNARQTDVLSDRLFAAVAAKPMSATNEWSGDVETTNHNPQNEYYGDNKSVTLSFFWFRQQARPEKQDSWPTNNDSHTKTIGNIFLCDICCGFILYIHNIYIYMCILYTHDIYTAIRKRGYLFDAFACATVFGWNGQPWT